MKEPDYQWQGAQGYQWWELDIVQDKFFGDEHELLIKINDNFTIKAFTTKKWHDYYWSQIHINNAYYQTSCEHVDEDLYWLLENLNNLVFLQNTKKNKIKSMHLKKFERTKEKLLLKPNIKAFNILGEVK